MYDTLEDMINSQGRLIFRKKTPQEMIISQDYMNYIMNQDLRCLVGEITELFMPSDLFLEIGESIFANDYEALTKLKKIDTILQNATYNANLDIVMFESVFRKYVSNGNITFFNKPITLNLEQRQKHINHMKKLIYENENINLRIIENSLLDDLKVEEKPSLYLSKNISFLKERSNRNSENYMIVNDKKLDKILKKFFEKVWIERKNINSDDKEESKKIISESLRYLSILNKNIIV